MSRIFLSDFSSGSKGFADSVSHGKMTSGRDWMIILLIFISICRDVRIFPPNRLLRGFVDSPVSRSRISEDMTIFLHNGE